MPGPMLWCCSATQCFGLEEFPDSNRLQWHGHAPYTPDWSESSRFIAFTIVSPNPLSRCLLPAILPVRPCLLVRPIPEPLSRYPAIRAPEPCLPCGCLKCGPCPVLSYPALPCPAVPCPVDAA